MSIFCGKRCQKRKDRRLELKYKKKMAKIDARTERVHARTNSRTTTRLQKQHTKAVAYSNGIDPNASKWGALASMTQTVGNVVSTSLNPLASISGSSTSVKAGPGGFEASNSQVRANNPPGGTGNQFPMWMLGLLLIPFLLKK